MAHRLAYLTGLPLTEPVDACSLAALRALLQPNLTRGEGCHVSSTTSPYPAVAYDEAFIRRLYDVVNLELIEPVQYGAWSGRTPFVDLYDIIVAERR
ncbi:MAG: hypothetical protein HC837_18625 [Chloroflexaceae bacterium]|nr:hypothetical protein [Chloroflexaceae bacterium]